MLRENLEMTVEGTREESIDNREVREVETVVQKPSRKRRRQAVDEIEEQEKRRKILYVDQVAETRSKRRAGKRLCFGYGASG